MRIQAGSNVSSVWGISSFFLSLLFSAGCYYFLLGKLREWRCLSASTVPGGGSLKYLYFFWSLISSLFRWGDLIVS